jgi:tyrosyl-tRNA synthetase
MKGYYMEKTEKIKELLTRGVQETIVREDLARKLNSGEKLRIKLGIDPTSPLLHLGHTVVLRKLRQFQELGHQVIFLVGDFTARVGDPSDKLSSRRPLTDDDIKENVKTYREQVGKVLDLSRVEMRYNMEWYGNMDLAELIQLMSLFSVNQMLERDMFQKRMKLKRPVWLHELLYPVLQGYDSVALRADVELGGTDQTFNMLTARTIQPTYNQPPQDIMTVQILEGTDGQKKMSKSIGNTINLTDTADEMFGKTMSIPDELIFKFFRLLTDIPEKEIKLFEQAMAGGVNPRNYKVRLGNEIVSIYHGKAAAKKAETEFERIFKQGGVPSGAPEFPIDAEKKYSLIDLLVETKCVTSKSESRRLIEQGGVELSGKIVKDWKAKVSLAGGVLLKVGKRKFIKFVNK